MLKVDRQSGGFTACNACPACPVGRNYRTEVESLTIPLGRFAPCLFVMSYELSDICCPHRLSVGGAFFMAILWNEK